MKEEVRRMFELSELILDSLEGRISEEEAGRLRRLLAEEKWARDYYCEYLRLFTDLNVRSHIPVFRKQTEQETVKREFDVQFWSNLLEVEQTAPAIEVEPVKPEHVPVKKVELEPKKKIRRTSLISAILAAAALFFALAYVQVALTGRFRPVASVTECLNTDWAPEYADWHPGMRLPANGKTAFLRAGVVKIEYDNGVEVVLEGPARFAMVTPTELRLDHGRLFAHVSEEGFGYTVTTPSSRVVDLGTEFGVEAHRDGDCELHVFQGKTLLVSPDVTNHNVSRVVTTGQARRVDSGSRAVREIALETTVFVRQVDAREGVLWRGEDLSLADVVNGGNGFGTGKAGFCIHPPTGEIRPAGDLTSQSWRIQWETARSYLRPVEQLPFVDCVIVPGRDGGEATISTTGLRVSGLPGLSGSLRWPIQTRSYYDDCTLVVNGQTVGTKGRPALVIHANSGITFDLEAIRRGMPDAMGFSAFEALCGISESRIDPAVSGATADVHVYLDGREVFSRTLPHQLNSAVPIRVDLREGGGRFLTLLVTSGERGNDNDWCVFAEPVLRVADDE